MIGNKIVDKITNVSINLPQNSLETFTNKTENIGINREITNERYIKTKKRQKIIGDLRLI